MSHEPGAAVTGGGVKARIERLTREQAALRRVAGLMARGSSPEEVFEAVTAEAARVLGTEAAGLLRFDDDATATLVAQSDTPWDPPALGTHFGLDGDNVVSQVFRTGEAARVDSWEDATGPVAAMADVLGVASCVATPITVEGGTWGVLIAATNTSDPLPADAQSRVRGFAELVATAIANAEARAQLSRLADEQAVLADEQSALRRVATLVAERPESEDLFSAVAHEVAGVLHVHGVIVDRFEPDGAQVTLGSAYTQELAGAAAFIGVGARLPLQPGTLAAAVFETHRAARIEDYGRVEGAIGEAVRSAGVGSGCAAPIMVDGRLWGQMCVLAARGTVLPPGTEDRLDDFVTLVATAISNYVARASLRTVAEEQAALRRVATLVARGATPEGVFRAVAAVVAALFGGDVSAIVRFEADGTATVLGDVGGPHAPGTRVTPDPGYVVDRVRETSRSARFDTDDPSSADRSSLVRTFGVRSAVASPIVVEGELWGAITAASQTGPLAPAAEQRLTEFTELVATAIANTQARDEVTTLAQEQAALRRVATLVAQGMPAPDIFTAVSEEVAHLFGTTMAAVGRFDGEQPTLVVVGAAEGTRARLAIGTCLTLDEAMVATRVHRTGRSARVGPRSAASATTLPPDFRGLIERVSAVASPIVVDGRLWGVMAINSERELPPDTQRRLEDFTELVAIAIANADTRAELTASRARIVAASDEARRRIERDLHDGAQQRLVSLGLELRMVAESVPAGLPELGGRLDHVADEIDQVLDDLREMSRGIHPAVLSDGGLVPAIETLALRATVPVKVVLGPPRRFAPEVEVAAYYVVSEALANTAKHANASRARVLISERTGRVRVSIDDDGDGGARMEAGSGLAGLRDRVEALGGSFRLSSSPGRGTAVTVELPVDGPDGPSTT